jgi:hypothetical protein
MATQREAECKTAIQEIIDVSGALGDVEKCIAEFWAAGAGTVTPPGMWTEFALNAARVKNLGVGDTIKLIFLQGNAVMDAGIATWAVKRFWNHARPLPSVHCFCEGAEVKSWAGAYEGAKTIPCSSWRPYIATPPFGDYTSGHSGFSAASAEVLRRFFDSDEFIGKNTAVCKAGSLPAEPKITDPANPKFRAGFTDTPNTGPDSRGYAPASDITLQWATWTDAANEAALSRLYGGIHIRQSNDDGKILGRNVGKRVWSKAFKLFNGITKTPCPEAK